MLTSVGIPLDGLKWYKEGSSDGVRPTFSSGAWKIDYKTEMKAWCILFNDLIAAYAESFAQSPCTVFQGEWIFLNGDTMKWERNNDLYICVIQNTQSNPYNLNDIGLDFFIRISLSRPIWFIDPTTDKVEHSGAKSGKRYCWKCKRCFSGNNFSYQHLKFHKRKHYRDDNYQDFLDAMISENL